MSEKRSQWIRRVLLIVAVLILVGFTVIPLLSMFQGQPAARTSPTTPATPLAGKPADPTTRKAELEAQAKGYSLVLQREPENTTALQGLVETRLQLLQEFNVGGPKDVIEPLEKLAKLKPEQTTYAILLAQAKEYTGDREGAVQTYRTVLNTQPGDAKALSGFTTLYLRQNQPEAAIGLLQDTLKKAPQLNATQPNTVDVATIQIMLGEVYAGLKRQPEAITAYDAAIAVDPNDARPVWGKARVLKGQANLEGAKELYKKAFALAKPEYKDAIKSELNQLTAATPAPPTPGQGQGSATPAATPAANNPVSPLPSPTSSPAVPTAGSNAPPANPSSSTKP